MVIKRNPRNPYRRVVVAVDFSENSRNTLEFALRLAREAEFHVLHCYEGMERQLFKTDVPPSEIMRYRRQLAKKARQEMKGFLDIVRRGHKRLIGGIWFGRARHVIPMVAKRLRGDDQGRVGLPCILLGTVAKHVIWQVDSDILMVRSGCIAIDIGGKTPRAT